MALINGVDSSQGMEVDVTPKAGRVILYDSSGAPLVRADQAAITPGTTLGMMGAAADRGLFQRLLRGLPRGDLAINRPSLFLLDLVEGTTINTALWTVSESGYAAAQANAVITLGNTSSTASGSFDLFTSKKQFALYKENEMTAVFRVNFGTLVANAVYEVGFGAPTGSTALINNGTVVRITSTGTVELVINYNGGSDQVTVFSPAPTLVTSTFYAVSLTLIGRRVHVQIEDEAGNLLVDKWVVADVTTEDVWAVTHLPVFARIYNSGITSVGAQLKIGSVQVHTKDIDAGRSWALQASSLTKHATIHPTTFVQTTSSMIAAPSTLTPSNTVAGYANLGGDYALAMTAASENPLSVFAFQIPSPYTFYLTSMIFDTPVVTTALNVTGIPFVEWLGIANCASGNINTGGGQRFPLGIKHFYTANNQAAGVTLNVGGGTVAGAGASAGPQTWRADVPIMCLPGTFLHIAWKTFIVSATATPGVTRGGIYVDGFFE